MLFAFKWPGIRTKQIIEKRKNQLTLQFKDMLYSLASALAVGKSVESGIQDALLDLKVIYPDPETDILVELEAFDLPADQAAALLASPTSLADIYREWGKADTHYMDDIRDVIENCAEDMADRSRDRPSVLEGLKRPAQPGPERKAPKSPSQER